MSRRVKEFIDASEFTSLDDLIEKLTAIRDSLPASAEAELRIKGDHVFGRKLSISYLREQTAEEAACDARYSDRTDASRQAEAECVEPDPGVACRLVPDRKRRAA
jgi:hypothetical protein